MSALVVPARRFRRYVLARRNNPLARPRRIDEARELAQVKKHWETLLAHWSGGWEKRKDDYVELERKAGAVLLEGLPKEFDLDVLAAADRMLHAGASIIGAVGLRYGADAALRVKMRTREWHVTSGRENNVWWWMLGTPKNAPLHVCDSGWHALRRLACAADDAAYALARDSASAFRLAETEPSRRVPFDFAFPAETMWAIEDSRAMLASPDFAKTLYVHAQLISVLVDADMCIEFFTRCPPRHALQTLGYACDIVAGMPVDDATRVLLAQAATSLRSKQVSGTDLVKLACAMTSIRSDAMAAGLAVHLRHPRFGRHVATYFEALPDLAPRALTTIANGKSLNADLARHVLEGAQRRATASASDGEDDVGPALLRETPWKKRLPRTTLELVTLPRQEIIEWAPGERERNAALPPVTQPTAQIRPISPEELVEFDALNPAHKYVDAWPRWNNKQWMVLELPDHKRVELWADKERRLYQRPPCFMLARFGESALDGLYARDPLESYDERALVSTFRVDSPRSAHVVARVLHRRRTWRVRGKTWLLAHPEAAAIGLIPAAFSREGRARRAAERSLRFVAANHPSVVRDVAARYGDDAMRAVDAFAFGEPVARLEVRASAPRWLRVDRLPSVRARDGRTLASSTLSALIDVLRARGMDVPYAGLAQLREELDHESANELTWALFLSWVAHGRARMHEWMAHSLAAFGDESTVARLAPYVRDWAHADPRACIVLVDTLAAIEPPHREAALLEIVEVEHVARAPELCSAVAEALGSRARGSSRDHAADIGLDERGEARLDLGSRTVRVVLDESLVPIIALDDGRRVRQVPRASKTDDPHLAAVAATRFKRFRREALTIAKTTLRRLEQGMIEERRYDARQFESRFARHPLVSHAARGLVWGVFAGSALVTTFRVVEDGTYADASDGPFALDPDAQVGVVHPLDMDDDDRIRWGMVLADYEILQPFEQLGRGLFRGPPAEAAALLKALIHITVPARSLFMTLDSHRWERPLSRRVASAWRPIRCDKPDARAFVAFTPGIALDQMRNAPPQKITTINVPLAPSLEGIHRMDLSELVRTALALRG